MLGIYFVLFFRRKSWIGNLTVSWVYVCNGNKKNRQISLSSFFLYENKMIYIYANNGYEANLGWHYREQTHIKYNNLASIYEGRILNCGCLEANVSFYFHNKKWTLEKKKKKGLRVRYNDEWSLKKYGKNSSCLHVPRRMRVIIIVVIKITNIIVIIKINVIGY